MSKSAISLEDQIVWAAESGTVLTAVKDLCMAECNTRSFTAGKRYEVLSMHPIAEPSYVKVKNDQGEFHFLQGKDLREFFGRKVPAEATAAYPLKNGGVKKKTTRLNMHFSYCPFCGVKGN